MLLQLDTVTEVLWPTWVLLLKTCTLPFPANIFGTFVLLLLVLLSHLRSVS